MKIFLLLLFISSFAYSEECIFDESSYINFIETYAAANKDSKIQDDKKTLVINKNGEQITITGGGCDHLGANISVKHHLKLNEKKFIKKTISLAQEYAAWLIDINELEQVAEKESWEKIDSSYRFNLNEMTVFEASQDDNGNIDISFYIN